mmetsp:Transcript_21870/g.36883  ORF Transcript_21870/g.36883 Transcript_21870/m.36883 type:complete len:134 (-) Transcript_21870:32-433(-)
MKIDFEIKAFAVSCVFALIKLLALSSQNDLHLTSLRAVFGLIHVYLFTIFIRAKLVIDNGTGSKESKAAARSELRKLFGSIAVRGIIISFVHVKTSMLPPLLVSSIMAIMSVLENDRCEEFIVGKKVKTLHRD